MIPLPSFWPWVLVAIVSAATGATLGYSWEHRARIAEVASIKAEIAKREAAATEEAYRRIEAAQKAADEAIAQRDARIQALDATNRRIRDELKTATSGRPCLSADARSVLQQSPAFVAAMPAPTGGTASAAPTAAADSGDSTDSDIAAWVIDAADLYEQCRARVDAIRQWDEVTNGAR
jgi:cell division protein FtsB